MVVVALAALSLARSALAQSCETIPGSVLETYPASGSRGVPLNGLVRVLYCPDDEGSVDRRMARLLRDSGEPDPGCLCLGGGECLQVGWESRCLQAVPANVALVDEEVVIETVAPLRALATYVIEAPDPSGPVRVSFQTGTERDESPPLFAGLDSVEIIGCGEGYGSNAACPDSGTTEGFVSILRATAAEDESGPVNIEYRAYQVRDNERIERGRVRGDGASDVTLSVFIPTSELTGDEWERICFAMTARDPFGAATEAEQTLCELTPEYSPFGSACAISPRRSTRPLGWLLLFVGLLLFRASSRRSGHH